MSAGTTDTTACCMDNSAAAEVNSSQSPTTSKAWILSDLHPSLAMRLLLLQALHSNSDQHF